MWRIFIELKTSLENKIVLQELAFVIWYGIWMYL